MLNFEQQLLARQAEVRGWIEALSRAAVSHGVAGTKGAQTDPDEWGRLGDLEARALLERDAVDRALDRLRQGSFGLCAECGEPLSFLRLESKPWADMCEECEIAR